MSHLVVNQLMKVAIPESCLYLYFQVLICLTCSFCYVTAGGYDDETARNNITPCQDVDDYNPYIYQQVSNINGYLM